MRDLAASRKDPRGRQRRLPRYCLLAACLAASVAHGQTAAEPKVDWDKDYVLGPLSLERQPGVERGTIEQLVHKSTDVFPGTIRRVWVYTPARKQLETVGDEGAAVMVFQDGHTYVDEKGGFHGPIVLDNLIHSGQMPPTVAIFVDPGHKGDAFADEHPGWQPTPSNRSLEYDTLSPDYARFLEREILPLASRAESVKAAGVRLTTDPERRGICGISSGGICAFTVAWERPDLFRKVVSHVGSFTDIRGGDTYPSIVRRSKGAPKPIRVILQDGEHDLDNQHGNWWLANLQMDKALAFAGYDCRFLGGVGGHNHRHGAAVLPEMLAWVWRDWKAAQAAARWPGKVSAQICEEGLNDTDAWPAAPLAATEAFPLPTFAVADLPATYVDDGVRGERPSPSLLRLKATVPMPAGVHRFLIRARAASRLRIGGTIVADTPFVRTAGDGSQHDTERLVPYDPGVGFRFAPAGEYEAIAEHEIAAAGPVEVVFEAFVGGRAGSSPRRVELGETVVAVMWAGTDAWTLLAADGAVIPYTDDDWSRYRAARVAELRRLDAAARAARRVLADATWDARHDAARRWVDAEPAVPVPAVRGDHRVQPPIDAFVLARFAAALDATAATADGRLDFFRDIQPFLESRCLECHRGPRAKGGLRLDDPATARAGGDSGPAIVPGDARAGELLRRVRAEDVGERMPPTGERLTKPQADLLERWIAEGAAWPDIRVGRREIAPPVDDLGFIRRVMLDTVGVPPSAAEAREFLADTSPDKRSRLIDRLLADDRWADHWMPLWQDLLAENPNILNPTLNNTGPFRRWLHDCLLDDLPLDRMVTQLVRQQGSVIAGGPAGFGMASQNDSPYATKGTILSAAFLGIDTKCARCHDSPAGSAKQEQLFQLGAMLAGRPLDVPTTSSVDPVKLHAGGRTPLIEVTLKPGTSVPPRWPFASPGGGEPAAERSSERPAAVSLPPSDDDVADQSAADTAAPTAVRAQPAEKPAGTTDAATQAANSDETPPAGKAKEAPAKPTTKAEPPIDMAARDRLAVMLTAPQNERFAEVAANRIWARFMGRGIVEPLDDWEKGRPTHPELLRWLGREFVRGGYRVKSLARLILNSAAYQRSVDPALTLADPLYAAAEPRRLWAEQVVDSLIAATGKPLQLERICLDLNGRREVANAVDLGTATRAWMLTSLSNERDRPSLSLPRLQAVADVLTAFGWRGSRQDPASVRDTAANPLQPAILSNGTLTTWLVRLSDDHPLTAVAISATSPEAVVDEIFMRLLTRRPTPAELELHAGHLRSGFQSRVIRDAAPRPREHAPPPFVTWTNHLQLEAGSKKEAMLAAAAAGDAPTRRLDPEWRQRCEDLIWTLVNAPEMLYRP